MIRRQAEPVAADGRAETEAAEAAGNAEVVETGEVTETAEVAEVSQCERLSSELEETRELLRRKQAEFENYRKRVERERREIIAHASADLILEILPVLDNLERAIGAASSDTDPQLHEGVLITYRQFRDILTKAGLREVEALGCEFDPHIHEAVGRVETTGHREGEVLEVYQKGYFMNERLLRPAMVTVAQSPVVPSAESGESAEGKEESSDADEQRADAERKGAEH